MRHTRLQRINAVGVAVILAVAMACASGSTPARRQFTAIADAAEAVHTVILIFNDRYQRGIQTEQQRIQILKTYKIYQDSVDAAVEAKKKGEPVDVLKIVNAQALPLLDLIASFGVKTP